MGCRGSKAAAPEVRRVAWDGQAYTQREFLEFHGEELGRRYWDMAEVESKAKEAQDEQTVPDAGMAGSSSGFQEPAKAEESKPPLTTPERAWETKKAEEVTVEASGEVGAEAVPSLSTTDTHDEVQAPEPPADTQEFASAPEPTRDIQQIPVEPAVEIEGIEVPTVRRTGIQGLCAQCCDRAGAR